MVEFNGNVSDNFLKLVQAVCTRPGMYVGRADFEKACIFLDGYSAGMAGLNGANMAGDHILHRHFQKFLVLKYGLDAARKRRDEDIANGEAPGEEPIYPLFGSVVWWAIYKLYFKGVPDGVLFSKLREDFEQFANPLTRMAVEVQ